VSVACPVEVHARASPGGSDVSIASWIVVAAALIEMLVMDLRRQIAAMIPAGVL
jgi:hypothetical protein